jgi:phosphohistidine phosphatase
MKVYIVRHGKAEPDAPSGSDTDRLLAPKGMEQARFLGASIARHGPSPTLIISSPVVRAFETARIIHAALDARLETALPLRVDEPVSGVIDLLDALAEGPTPPPCVMLVGHNPQVSELCEVLVNGVSAARCTFRTGEAVLLSVAPANLVGTGRLLSQLRLEEECGTTSGH